MKQLKLIWAIFLGGAVALSSCESLNVNPSSADSESAVLDLFFLATGDDSTHVMRGHHGKCNLTEVAAEDLPAGITDYITANYPNATIDRAGQSSESGNYAVKITKEDGTHTGLLFTGEGVFISEKKQKAKPNSIDVADLPAAITDYVAANYEGAAIKKAFQGDDGNYGVLLVLEDDSYLGVGFDTDGNYLGELSMRDIQGKKHGPGKKKRH